MTKKNKLSILVALALVAALAVGSTLAFFTDKDEETNVFTLGKIDIDLKESDDGGESWTDDGLTFEDVVPGDTEDKYAKVIVAEDSNDCFIAVKVELDGYNEYDEDTGKGFTEEEIAALLESIRKGIDDTVWTVTETDDGALLCVCNEICKAEDEVVLFEKVTIPLGDMTLFGNNLFEESFEIVLNAYAVQSDNMVDKNGDPTDDPNDFDWNQFDPQPTPTPTPTEP